MFTIRVAAAAVLASSLLLGACQTIEGQIQTPIGPQSVVEGPFQILRMHRRIVASGNMANAYQPFQETIVVSCPRGTVTVVPIPQGETYGFGKMSPDDITTSDTWTWSQRSDHHLGLVDSGIWLTDIDAPDANGEQRVELEVLARVLDYNGDDRFFWIGTFQILCLGQSPSRPIPVPR